MNRKIGFGERRENIKKQLNILIQLARIDRNFAQEEKLFIREFSRRYNISRSELEEIEHNSEKFGDISAFTMDEKVEVLYNAIRLAKADRRILPNEIVYCQEIATKLGFRRSVIDAILPLVNDQPLEQINYSSVRRKIAPFL
jgi:hypothetical protein